MIQSCYYHHVTVKEYIKDRDEMVTVKFLVGLSSTFKSTSSVILAADKLSNLKEVYSHIQQSAFEPMTPIVVKLMHPLQLL